MEKLKSRKGISPLIASVLLIAFTMAVATIAGPWVTNLLQNTQEGVSQQAVDVTRASNLGLEIMSVSFNRSSNELQVVVQNTGEPINNKTNISIGVIGSSVAKTQQYNVELDSKEITTLNLPVDRTYPLETIKADLTNYPVSTEQGIKCTPTKGLVGYWTFNDEQTESDWLVERVGRRNGSISGGISPTNAVVGESYEFDGSDDEVTVSDDTALNLGSGELTFVLRAKFTGIPTTYWTHTLVEGDDATSGSGWWIRPNKDNDKLQFLIGDSGSSFYALNTQSSFDSSKWYQVSGKVNGSHMVISVNGEADRVKSVSSYDLSAGDFYIGHENSGGRFQGLIDETRIYNRSLSQSEIQRLYNVRSEDWAVSGCKLTG